MRRETVRLSSKELFIFYYKLGGESKVGGCTNKRILSNRTGIDYSKLMWIFTRKNRIYYEDGEVVILKLFTSDIQKGSQSIKRRGRGGMEAFARYISKGVSY